MWLLCLGHREGKNVHQCMSIWNSIAPELRRTGGLKEKQSLVGKSDNTDFSVVTQKRKSITEHSQIPENDSQLRNLHQCFQLLSMSGRKKKFTRAEFQTIFFIYSLSGSDKTVVHRMKGNGSLTAASKARWESPESEWVGNYLVESLKCLESRLRGEIRAAAGRQRQASQRV